MAGVLSLPRESLRTFPLAGAYARPRVDVGRHRGHTSQDEARLPQMRIVMALVVVQTLQVCCKAKSLPQTGTTDLRRRAGEAVMHGAVFSEAAAPSGTVPSKVSTRL